MGRQRANISSLSRLLGGASLPVYVLDEHRKITYCNRALSQWLEVDIGHLLELRCGYTPATGDSMTAKLASALCPPPQAFAGHRMSMELVVSRPDDEPLRRPAECYPLAADTDIGGGVLVVAADASLPNSTTVDAVAADGLHRRLQVLLDQLGADCGLDQIIGEHPAIVQVRQQVRMAAETSARVVVVGPPGSGREYVARAIHYGRSSTQAAPLAPLACSLLDAELLEATITSFVASCGELEIEQPGALLLLEIDQLPADAQLILAGILSIGELNVCTLATARTPLAELAAAGTFRADLACLLSTLVVQIPPLIQRREDIPLLSQYFLEQLNAERERHLNGFSTDAMDQLVAYAWPENLDELREVVQAAGRSSTGPVVQPHELPERMRRSLTADKHPLHEAEPIALDELLAEIERELLMRAIQQAKGNRAQAARLLNVSRARLLRRLEHFGIS